MDVAKEPTNVIVFPRRPRVAPTAPSELPNAAPSADGTVFVDHDGRVHGLERLIRYLSSAKLSEVEAAGPRSAQELWDEVVRRWPGLAEEIVAAVSGAE